MTSWGQENRRNTSPAPDLVGREILLSFWKIHILHHAQEGPVYGQWIATELRRHGYEISPGTLYPLLKRMESNGWLKSRPSKNTAGHSRKEYRLTREGERILSFLRSRVAELHREVMEQARAGKHRPA
jgi:DNA-binding PadR family transcriptional regulator